MYLKTHSYRGQFQQDFRPDSSHEAEQSRMKAQLQGVHPADVAVCKSMGNDPRSNVVVYATNDYINSFVHQNRLVKEALDVLRNSSTQICKWPISDTANFFYQKDGNRYEVKLAYQEEQGTRQAKIVGLEILCGQNKIFTAPAATRSTSNNAGLRNIQTSYSPGASSAELLNSRIERQLNHFGTFLPAPIPQAPLGWQWQTPPTFASTRGINQQQTYSNVSASSLQSLATHYSSAAAPVSSATVFDVINGTKPSSELPVYNTGVQALLDGLRGGKGIKWFYDRLCPEPDSRGMDDDAYKKMKNKRAVYLSTLNGIVKRELQASGQRSIGASDVEKGTALANCLSDLVHFIGRRNFHQENTANTATYTVLQDLRACFYLPAFELMDRILNREQGACRTPEEKKTLLRAAAKFDEFLAQGGISIAELIRDKDHAKFKELGEELKTKHQDFYAISKMLDILEKEHFSS